MMNAWVFIVMIGLSNGAVQSEAFDQSTMEACKARREMVLDMLIQTPVVSALYVGECVEIKLSRKT